MAVPFACSGVNAIAETVVTCGEFQSPVHVTQWIGFVTSAWDVFAVPIDFGNLNLGGLCKYSKLTYVVTDMTGQICDSGQYSISSCKRPDTDFPYCVCQPGVQSRTPYDVEYSRKYSRSNPTGSGSVNVYCFKVKVNATQCGTARCCGMDLNKIEWLSDETYCTQAVAGWQVSTAPTVWRSPVWAREDDNSNPTQRTFGVLKTNELGLSTANANNVEVCIALRATSACPTMEQFCFDGAAVGCRYAIFNRAGGGSCCATDYAPGNNYGAYARLR